MKRAIIFVDDERNILDGLRRSLRKLRRDWNMEFANNGEEALNKLSQGSFDVIVTDMRMPGMDGAELLYRVHERYPQMLRIVLSGQCEEEATIRAVKNAHFFLSKPCNVEELQKILGDCFCFISTVGNDEAKSLALGLEKVPILSSTINSIRELIEAGEEDTGKYGDLVVTDPPLAGKLLNLVHSQFFVTAEKPFSVRKAVELITVRIIGTLIGKYELFDVIDENIPGTGLIRETYKTSVIASRIAVRLSEMEALSEDQSIIVYKSTLFSDIGIPIFVVSKGTEYVEAVGNSSMVSLSSIERERFGFSHDELGALLLCSWGFPAGVVEFVRSHHTVGNWDSYSKLNGVACAGIYLAYGLREGDPSKYMSSSIVNYITSCGLSSSLDDMVRIAEESGEPEESVAV